MMRPSDREKVARFNDVLAEMQRSGSIYFVKSLSKTAIPTPMTYKTTEMVLPAEFVRENQDKIQEWVTLRAQSSLGISLRSWAVRLSVSLTSSARAKVRFVGGWKTFAADNHLKEGDSLIFVLKEGARSEFEVRMFRGSRGSAYFPDKGTRIALMHEEEEISDSIEENNNRFRLQDEHKMSIQLSHHNNIEHF